MICSNNVKALWAVYLDREMFLLSMLLVSTSFKQQANLIVHYHRVKIVYGYTQQGQNTRVLFSDNVFTLKQK